LDFALDLFADLEPRYHDDGSGILSPAVLIEMDLISLVSFDHWVDPVVGVRLVEAPRRLRLAALVTTTRFAIIIGSASTIFDPQVGWFEVRARGARA
jgi:hypothetical protein